MTPTERLELLLVRRANAAAKLYLIEQEIEQLRRDLNQPRPDETVWPDKPGEY